jgi:hypothetical protein
MPMAFLLIAFGVLGYQVGALRERERWAHRFRALQVRVDVMEWRMMRAIRREVAGQRTTFRHDPEWNRLRREAQ